MKNLDNIKEVFEKTRAMYSVGMAEVTDVDQMAVQVTYLKNSANSAERQIELAYNLLRLQLGVDAESVLILTDNLDGILLRIDFESTLAEQFDLKENIDYRMMNTQQITDTHRHAHVALANQGKPACTLIPNLPATVD